MNDMKIYKSNIMIVDDKIPNLQLLNQLLSDAGYRVRAAREPKLAIESAGAHPPNLILLDVKMPEMDGFEVCRRLKQDERTRDIPVIFISALHNVQDRIRGFEAGGVDFISKPIQKEEVLARVRTHLELHNMKLVLENLVAERTSELAASEEKFKGVFNSMIDVFTRSDMDGYCLMVSPSIFNLLGYKPEEILGKNFADFYADPNQRNEIVNELQNTNEVKNFEIELVRKDGKTIIVSTNSKLYYDSDGVPLGVEGNLRDITERRMAEIEKIQLFTLSNDLITIVGFDGYFKQLNPAWEKTTGHTLEELKSKPFKKFVHPDDWNATAEKFNEVKSGNQIIHYVNRYLTKNGDTRYFSWNVTPLVEQSTLYCIARDITKQKLIEEKIIEYQQRLKSLANELILSEEKQRRQIATDLHDNVGQMLAFSRLQIEALNDSMDKEHIMAKLTSISSGLLNGIEATRNAIFELSPPQLNEIGLVGAVSEWMDKEMLTKHKIKYNISSDEKKYPISKEIRYLLFRCVRELLNNVIKHAAASQVKINVINQNGMLVISLYDNGCGFSYSPEILHIQEAGFGLFSIQERIDSIGGRLVLDSSPGKGTKVELFLPLSVNERS